MQGMKCHAGGKEVVTIFNFFIFFYKVLLRMEDILLVAIIWLLKFGTFTWRNSLWRWAIFILFLLNCAFCTYFDAIISRLLISMIIWRACCLSSTSQTVYSINLRRRLMQQETGLSLEATGKRLFSFFVPSCIILICYNFC